jgi:RNA polymerase-binding transcription factor DksA
MIQSLMAASQDNARRGDLVDQASIALDQDVMIRIAAIRRRAERDGASAKPRESTEPVFCIDCGGEIPKKRLEALPETRLCVGCKEKRSS